jgi:HK97 family phage major capsid protein
MTLKEMKERRAAIYATEIDNAQNDAELDKLQTEIRKLDLMIAEEERKAEDNRTAAVNEEIPVVVQASAQEQRKSVDEEEMEYRKAFQQFVTKGTPIPAELRDNESTTLADIPGALPTVLVNRIVEKLESTGMILPLVNKTSFAAGISIPTSTVKPVATWVAEGSGSNRQRKTTSTSITFTNFKLRCEISMSMEASTMALSAFEAAFERQVVEAMTKAIEAAIIKGAYDADGTTLVGPKGILSETPATGQALTAKTLSYDTLVKAEAALPQAYEDGAVYCMTKKTFMAYVGMEDAEGQPVARVTYGIGGKPERTLLGRTVVLCGDYMDSFSSTLKAGKIFAFLFKFSDYTMNTIYDMGVQRKQDWDTEDMLTKAVMSVDGKVIDKNSLVTIAKA